MSIVEKAVQTVVKLLPDRDPDPLIGSNRVLGKPLSRVDGKLKVTGTARFAAEIALDRLSYAALVYSTIARGRVTRIDADAARAAPCVLAVITHENCPRMNPPPMLVSDPNGMALSGLPVLQSDEVRWNGQPVAVVVAETQEAADHAASLVQVAYEEEAAALDFAALQTTARIPPNVLGRPPEIRVGDAEAAFAAAPHKIDQVYRTPREYHVPIELHALTAAWHGDDRLTVHDSTQGVLATRHTIAKVFDLDPANVRVLSPFVGGAFGSKTVWNHTLLCIAAARLLQRPVRLVLSREGTFRATGGRTCTEQRVALGAREDGTLAALIHTGTTAVVSHNAFPEQFSFSARQLYAADTIFVQQKVVDLDMVSNTAMRAPGETPGTFALESAIDELAVALNLDPIELRTRLEPEKDPVTGNPFSSRNLLEAYRQGAEQFGWSARQATPRSNRDGEWLVGHGVATATFPYIRRPASARIRLAADGSVRVESAAAEMGMGTATAQVQHAAERLGLEAEQVTFAYGDSELPASPIAGGSAQTASVAGAIQAACDALVKELVKLAGNDSPLSGASPEELLARDGGLYRRDGKGGEGYGDILRRAGRDMVEVEAQASAATELAKYAMHSWGAQFAEVRVNTVTGEVRVARLLGSFDVGAILNAKTGASQLRGGMIMGIGMALTEEAQFDVRSGRFINASMAEYHVPVHLDVPKIDVIWTGIPDPLAPLGLRGIGEIGITGVAAAIANAVYNATGKRIRELPITLDKLLDA